MTFQPLVPLTGLPGYAFLQATLDRQTATFDRSPQINRDTTYFEARIAEVRTADDLVSDRRLLRVALGAFGLQDDINSRAFVRAILEQGTARDDALANRLTDDRYRALSEAFGFADRPVPRTQEPGFGAEITAQFRRRSFEVAVGDQSQALRLAMNADRALAEMATDPAGDRTLWFRLMGTPPLRQVMQVALGLPASFAQQDLDRQVTTFSARARERLGIESLSDLADDSLRERVIRQFLLRDQINSAAPASSGSIALMLLQAAPRRIF